MKGNRKFFLVSGALVMGFVLALLGKLTPEFATIATICIGAFSWANTKEHEFNGKPDAPAA